MEYKIASFNMYKFKAYENTENTKKNLDKLVKIISEEKFDIVAMQEMLNEYSLKSILMRLGSNWDGYWDSPNSKYGSSISREGYAFIWRKDELSLITTKLENGEERTFYPRILNQYKKGVFQQRLVRNPYYIRLKPKYGTSGRYEIRLIDTHIMFAKNSIHQISEEDVMPSDIQLRKNEYQILCENIYPTVADKRYGDNMPAYTILLGDYNLNLPKGNNGPYLVESVTLDTGRKIVTRQHEKTTISVEKSAFVNNYDHFSFDEKISQNCRNIGRVNTVYKYYGVGQEAFEKHKKEISDHVPIVMDFNVKEN